MKSKSYTSTYWCIWIVLVVCLVIARANVRDEHDYFSLFMIYAVPTWLATMALNAKEGYRLNKYMKEHHTNKWEELTHVPFMNTFGYNGFRIVPFIYSSDNLGDSTLKELKQSYRSCVTLAMVVFLAMIPLSLYVMLPWGT